MIRGVNHGHMVKSMPSPKDIHVKTSHLQREVWRGHSEVRRDVDNACTLV